MTVEAVDPNAQARTLLEKAEGYQKLGLNAQVQHELSEAERLNPDIVKDPRFQRLHDGLVSETQRAEALRNPLRIGAAMLLVDAALGVFLVLLILAVGDGSDLGAGDFIGPIINVIIGINLWRGKSQWRRYTVWWVLIGLVIFGGRALIVGNFVSLIAQLGFSGSLMLLLVGVPSRERVIISVVLYVLGYIGFVLGFLAMTFIVGFVGAF